MRRLPTYNLGAATYARAIPAGIVAGIALGIAWAFFNDLTYWFYGILVGVGIGFAAGELVSIATNRKSGPPLQTIAVASVGIAFLLRTALLLAFDDDWTLRDVRSDAFALIALGFACFIAMGRLR